MEIHQLVHTLHYGDAISGEVIALQRALQKLGYKSEIFSINTHLKYEGLTKKYTQVSDDFSGELIFHYSLGSPINDLYRRATKAYRTLIYHNITPAKWFEGINPRVANDIRQGINDLGNMCRLSDRIIADSPFNASEIKALGFDCEVLELPVDPARWTNSADPEWSAKLNGNPALHLLAVGRIAPNKKLEDILKIFYFLRHKVYPNSRLWIVGGSIDTEIYSFALRRLAYELKIYSDVCFVGPATDEELRAFYENCSFYLSMSEHEGFCVPVLEAMHFGLPVIGYAEGAIPDTMGNGGILIKEKRHAEIAELIASVYKDKELLRNIKEVGRKRVADISYDRFEKRIEEIFSSRQQIKAVHASSRL